MVKKKLAIIKTMLNELLALAKSGDSRNVEDLGRIILHKNEELKAPYPQIYEDIIKFVNRLTDYAKNPNNNKILFKEALDIRLKIFKVDQPEPLTEEEIRALKKEAYIILKEMYATAITAQFPVDTRIDLLKSMGAKDFGPIHSRFGHTADDFDHARNNIGFIPGGAEKYQFKLKSEEYLAKIKKQLEKEGII